MVIVDVDMVIQILSIVIMTIGLFMNRDSIVAYGGFILLYSFLHSLFTFDDELEEMPGDDA